MNVLQVKPPGGFRIIARQPRTFQIVAAVSGPLEGELQDWPQQMQETVYKALERKAKEISIPLTIVFSAYAYDAIEYGHYVQIIASEIIAGKKGVKSVGDGVLI